MDAREWGEIDRIVVTCTEGLFRSLGVAVEHVGHLGEPASAPRQILAVLGFGGLQITGTLSVSADARALEFLYPPLIGDRGADDTALRDWSGELANLLLGRVKSHLLSFGLVIQPGLPATLSGVELGLGTSERNALCVPHLFRTSGSAFQVRFEAVAKPGVHMTPLADAENVPHEEGDVILF